MKIFKKIRGNKKHKYFKEKNYYHKHYDEIIIDETEKEENE